MSVVFADLDGDGKTDVLWYTWRDGAVIGVCTAAGVRTRRGVGGQGEIFGALDIQPGGPAAIGSGGTTVSAGYTNIYLLSGDHIVSAHLATGREVTFVSGFADGIDRRGRPRSYSTWGCADVVGGPARRSIYRLRGAWLEVVSSRETAIPARYANPRHASKYDLHVGDVGCQGRD
jgi:hypothetical protein